MVPLLESLNTQNGLLFHPVPHTSPPASVVTGICTALRAAYPAGIGSAAIRRSMPPNSRRVRWLSASSSQ